jgi:hypothetical protein
VPRKLVEEGLRAWGEAREKEKAQRGTGCVHVVSLAFLRS